LDAVADVGAASSLLVRVLKPGDVVLLKASRAAQIERVLVGLQERLVQTGAKV
jgi:UDP-N-acetylmuramyl pentapeptide synthase